MRAQNTRPTAIDLFAGAGGLSLGFSRAGFNIILAIDNDADACRTYRKNSKRANVQVLTEDVGKVDFGGKLRELGFTKGGIDVVLGGAPCQGFSASNKRTRSLKNPKNLLFERFVEAVEEIYPRWVLFENVSGIMSLEKGRVVQIINTELEHIGYLCKWAILNAADYGIPQVRRRFLLVGNRVGVDFTFPSPTHGNSGKPYTTVRDAISDLPVLQSGNRHDVMAYRHNAPNISEYQREMRMGCSRRSCTNNQVSRNNDLVVERYTFIPQGGNWGDIPAHLMRNYKDTRNCHSGIYRRLKWDEPSIVIGNFRKNMLIHPEQDRGLSVREAARLQSFPDWYVFQGGLVSQQQQVADAVPPGLGYRMALSIKDSML
jgi:DNA (cytosine-5)-methyltransferase 1